MIAGLETPTSGEILIGGQVVNALSPRERRIAMVFQSYALYPHLSVYKNIAFPLKAQNVNKELHKQKVEWAAVSPGHRRAPSIASRVNFPAVSVNASRSPRHRSRTRGLPPRRTPLQPRRQASCLRSRRARAFHRRVGTTTIYVTHDQVEAMAMGDRVMVLNKGVGSPARHSHRGLRQPG